MFCPECGSELPLEAAFCQKCGKRIKMNNVTPEYSDTKVEDNSEIALDNNSVVQVQVPAKPGSGKGIILFVLLALVVIGICIYFFFIKPGGGASTLVNQNVKIDVSKIVGSSDTRAKVSFGEYWQEDTNGDGKCDKNDDKQPIVWQIIHVDEDGNALLFADKILDHQPFHTEYIYITWETCSLRKWLNGKDSGDFLKEAFSEDQQKLIKDTKLTNKDSGIDIGYPGSQITQKIPGGNDTVDKVFLLSVDDMKNEDYKWKRDEWECCELYKGENTGYSLAVGEFSGDYRLRSPGSDSYVTAVVSGAKLVEAGWEGGMGSYGDNNTIKKGVRPAIYINLKEAGLVDKIQYEQPVSKSNLGFYLPDLPKESVIPDYIRTMINGSYSSASKNFTMEIKNYQVICKDGDTQYSLKIEGFYAYAETLVLYALTNRNERRFLVLNYKDIDARKFVVELVGGGKNYVTSSLIARVYN